MKSLLARASLALVLLLPLGAWAQVSVSIEIAPPPLPVYVQPQVPGDGYIWVPGYWAWDGRDAAYYWVPGTWVLAPNEGDLWTPGYWAFEGAGYFWHIGYWGPRVGFYGGINYGFGYFGSGYQGGRWDHGAFRYNQAVSNVDAQVVHNVYSAPAPHRGSNHVSFNGGRGGAPARPTGPERQFQAAEHAGPRAEQEQHETTARGMPTQRATGPHGVPQVAATPRLSEFAAPGVQPVRTAPAVAPGRAPVDRGEGRPGRAPPAAPERPQRQIEAPVRTEAPRAAPRAAQPRPEQRAPGRQEAPQQEGQAGQPRRER